MATVIALIALTLGSALLLRCALCMAIMLLLSLFSMLLAYFTMRLDAPGKALSVLRRQTAENEMRLSFISILPLGGVVFVSELGRTLHFGCMPFARHTRTLKTACPHVGVFPWGSGTLYFTDVFNLFVFSRRFDKSDMTLTVLPRAFRTDKPENRSREAGNGEVRLVDDADEPSGVRDWVEGDLLKRVHWKLSMKSYDPVSGGIKPIVRTYEEATRPDILVLPDLSLLDAPDERAAMLRDGVCESALSVCRAVVEGKDAARLVLCRGEVSEFATGSRESLTEAATALAQTDFSGIVPFESLISEAMRRVGVTSTAVFVTTRVDERCADMLVRLRGYSGMNVAVLFVSESINDQSALLQAKLETSGISVKQYIPGNRGVSA